jgi:hypothetical protein
VTSQNHFANHRERENSKLKTSKMCLSYLSAYGALPQAGMNRAFGPQIGTESAF